MIENADGSIDFIKDKTTYRFGKFNYEKHVEKRPRIDKELGKIEDAILSPDRITTGPKRKQKNFYRALSYNDNSRVRYVTFWKIITFKESNALVRIATCIYNTAPNFYAVNPNEKTIWIRPNSQI